MILPKPVAKSSPNEIVRTPEWEDSIKKLNALSPMYQQVFKETLIRARHNVYKMRINKGFEIRVILPKINNCEVEMILLERDGGNIEQAHYYLFDNRNNVSYVRDISLV